MNQTTVSPAVPRGGSDLGGNDPVWYVSYGSNMLLARLMCYLAGGTPPGTTHRNPGCRDRRPPRLAVPVMLPGMVYFALDAKMWSGGVAFYDPAAPGEAAARAYLLTASQFSDIVAQEMQRVPGRDLDLREVLSSGREQLGPGCYETLVLLGHRDGHPLLTFTAPWQASEVRPTVPSAAYLAMLAGGLRESHGWTSAHIADYLSARPGALGTWRSEEVERLIDLPPHGLREVDRRTSQERC